MEKDNRRTKQYPELSFRQSLVAMLIMIVLQFGIETMLLAVPSFAEDIGVRFWFTAGVSIVLMLIGFVLFWFDVLTDTQHMIWFEAIVMTGIYAGVKAFVWFGDDVSAEKTQVIAAGAVMAVAYTSGYVLAANVKDKYFQK